MSRLTLLLAATVVGASGCRDRTPTAPELANHPPQFGAVGQLTYHDVAYDRSIEVSDTDGDPVSVRALVLPTWLAFDSVMWVLHGTPGVEGIGKHRVTLVASDGTAQTTLSFELEVRPRLSVLTYDGPWFAAGFSFGHDGKPVATDHFTLYSGFSSPMERTYVADVLEGHFADYRNRFDIRSLEELDGWRESTAIPVLTLRYQGTDVLWTGQSYRYGLIVHAPDSPRYAREGYTRSLYDQLLRHELMHVLEYYLVGQNGTYDSVQKWFHEGIATVMGGKPPAAIRSTAALHQWQQDMGAYPGMGNPIAIETGADYPSAIQNDAVKIGRYYETDFFSLMEQYLG